MEWMQIILFTECLHHPQFFPAGIYSPHVLAFAYKYLFLSVWKKQK
jgi:hypothetical protein